MAKRKDSTALFEVIKRGKPVPPVTTLPEWAQPQAGHPVEQVMSGPRVPKSLKQPPGLEAEVAAPAAEPGMESMEPAAPPARVEPPAVFADPSAVAHEPFFSVVHNRLRLSMNYVTCSFVVAALVVLLAASYKLGQMSGRGQMPGKTATAAVKLDYPQEKLQTQLESLPKGLYMVIQSNVATWDEATAIQRFLYKQGIDTGIKTVDGMPFWIVDMSQNFAYRADKPSEVTATQEKANKHYKALVDLGKKPDWELKAKYDFTPAGQSGLWYEKK